MTRVPPVRGAPPPAIRIVQTGSHRPPAATDSTGPAIGPSGARRPTQQVRTPRDARTTVAISGVRPATPVRGPAATSPLRDRQTPRLVLPFLLTGLICVLVVSLVSVWLSRVIAAADAVDAAISATEVAADVVVAPVLTDAVLAGDVQALAALDRAVRDGVLNVSMLRVKIWDPAGTIVYSDERRLVGERFVLDEGELAVLQGSAASAELSDLASPENRYEDPSVPLLEVYLPMRTPSGRAVLFEAYSRYAGVTAAAQRIWLRFLPLGLGALVLLELLQLPIAVGLARRLRRAQAQREEVLQRSMSAVDDERRRIAGDLHDGVVQDLAGVAFTVGAASRVGRAGHVDPEQLAEAADRIRRAVRALRSLLVEIYPPNLYDEGLHAALSDLVARLVPPDVAVSLDVAARLPRLDTERTELVYRVAQEGLRNVARHARASSVVLTLRPDQEMLVLSVADDGAGCEAGRLRGAPGHLGLRALGGFAAGLDAALLIDSAPGEGTTLVLEVPL